MRSRRASDARCAAGHPARATCGLAPAASNGTLSIREECAPFAFTSGVRLSASRAADGRRIRIGTRSDPACSLAGVWAHFSNWLKDDDGDMPFRTLPVNLVASVAGNNARPEALALLRGRLPCPYLPYFPSQLDFCLRVGTKVEIPRGVVLLPSIGRNHNNGFSFSEPEDRSGSGLAALPPSCGEEDDRASHHAAENPSARQPIDCSMERVEDASSGQFPSHHVSEAVQFPHAGV